MASSKYIQFRGIPNVLAAYKNRHIETWAVFQDKMLITKGDGMSELKDFLEMLTVTSCPYTLKVYDNIDSSEVKDNTGSDGSFHFKLTEEESDDIDRYSETNKKNRLFQRLEKLEQMNGLNNPQDEEDEEPETIEDAVIGMIEEPWRLADLANTIKGIFGLQPGFAPPQPPYNAAMGNTNPSNNMNANNTTEQNVARVEKALNTLEQYDKRIVDHLEKLAHIASTNPSQFNFLINALDTIR